MEEAEEQAWEKARKEAVEQARQEAEEQARQEEQERARQEAEEQASREAQEQASREVEALNRLSEDIDHSLQCPMDEDGLQEHSDDEAEEIASDEEMPLEAARHRLRERMDRNILAAQLIQRTFREQRDKNLQPALAQTRNWIGVASFFDDSREDQMIMHEICTTMIQALTRGWYYRYRP
jgi:hypothetical protein